MDRTSGDQRPSRFPADVAAAAHVVGESTAPQVMVDGDAGHHLRRVLRLRVGESVTVADGAGRWRPYRVADLGDGAVTLDSDGEVEAEPMSVPSITVAFSLTKRDKPDLVVQKLTELGVDRIIPVASDHSVVRWDERQAAAARVRLGRIAREACEQCRRARVPEIAELTTIAALLTEPGLMVAERAGASVLDVDLSEHEVGGLVVIVGPEGGFSAAEKVLLRDIPGVSLGDHVLRAETAALAVAACLTAQRARYYNSA